MTGFSALRRIVVTSRFSPPGFAWEDQQTTGLNRDVQHPDRLALSVTPSHCAKVSEY